VFRGNAKVIAIAKGRAMANRQWQFQVCCALPEYVQVAVAPRDSTLELPIAESLMAECALEFSLGDRPVLLVSKSWASASANCASVSRSADMFAVLACTWSLLKEKMGSRYLS
jgi:hypothetical protein